MASVLALTMLVVLALVFIALLTINRIAELKQSLEQIPQIIARVYKLEQRLLEIDRKLTALHPSEGTPTNVVVAEGRAAHIDPQTSPLGHVDHPLPGATFVPDAAPTSPHPAVAGTPAHDAATGPTVSSTGHAAATMHGPHASVPAPRTDIESLIAGRWLNLLGIAALALAALFFLKYAFDNDWIGPTGRVGIGIGIGVLLFPLSDWLLHRGYKYFAEGIVGLGVVVLYLSIWTGWHVYDLFPQTAAFGFMVLITAATIVVGLVRDSQRIAAIALIGGLLTPILTSSGENQEEGLFVFLAILGLGAVLISWWREWRVPALLLFFGTVFYFWGWYADFYYTGVQAETLFFATLFFAIFAALPAIRAIRKGAIDGADVTLTLANSLQFLCALGILLWTENPSGLALALLILGAAHLGVAMALPKSETQSRRAARILYGGLALTFATIAIPARLNGEWITIAFAVEAAALTWGGLRIDSRPLRVAGLVIYPLVVIRLFIDADVLTAATFLLNARFLTFAVCAASMFAAFVMVRGSDTVVGPAETKVYYAVAICANLVFLVALSMEIWDWFGRMPASGGDQSLAQQLALSILWIIYASVLLAFGIIRKSAAARWQGLVLLGFAVAKVFLFDLQLLTRFYRIVSFLVLGLVLMVVSFLYQHRSRSGESS